MEELFLTVVNLSLTAGWLVLAVLVLRLFLHRAPKWSICMLWALVALRLVFPISIESALSLIPSAQPLPQEILYTAAPEIQSGIPALNSAVNPVLQNILAPSPTASANPTQFWSFLLSRVWMAGMVGLLLYGLISTLLLKRQLATATLLEGNVKQSERVASPFVLGLFHPVIYLPYHILEGDLDYVLAHERSHIRRLDHWWKLLGFVLLAVYWFHPLMWVAYVLFCRDLEGACDEKVIRALNLEERRGYSTALLHCSIRRRPVAPCPLAFGESGVKSRIKAVMNYKKPAFWVVLIALAACVIAALCFLTNPKSPQPSPAGLYRYEGDGFGGAFTITLRADGSFTYYEGGLSSYIGDGKWSVSGAILTLEDETGVEPPIVNRFRMEGDDLIFLADGSTNFIYVKVADGSVFSKSIQTPVPAATATKWFDYIATPSEMDWEQELTITHTAFPDVTFRYTPEEITAQQNREETPLPLISGMPIWNAYFCDLNGDGLPELCATLSLGSGIVDTRIMVCDYANGRTYELEDRMKYDYALRFDPDSALLYVDRTPYEGREPDQSGLLMLEDSVLTYYNQSPN